MMQPTLRLLPYAFADGPHNMAADETMLLSAIAGRATLRFYGWSPATLSLGYFQPASARLTDSNLATLPWVRRMTGGATLVHHHELTYALALPPQLVGVAQAWMPRMHRIIASALSSLQTSAFILAPAGIAATHILCFHQHTQGDLLCAEHKILGSAQRKQRQALLQHGGILLTQSEHTPSLPGIKELAGFAPNVSALMAAIVRDFEQDTAWQLVDEDWGAAEKTNRVKLAAAKYASPSWNDKR